LQDFFFEEGKHWDISFSKDRECAWMGVSVEIANRNIKITAKDLFSIAIPFYMEQG
jgi:hypothetical protein